MRIRWSSLFRLSSLIVCVLIAFWKQIHAIASNRIMKSTKIWLIIVIVLVVISLVVVTDEALSWGTFLGANWKKGEAKMRRELSQDIKSAQRVCTKDVEKLCENGRYVNGQADAYTYWTSENYRRHTYKHWSEVPFGFGYASDNCLRQEYEQYNAGTMTRRLIPKCAEWIEKSEKQFEDVLQREKGNDKREMFVLFSTLFATVMSGILGYILGIFLNDRDDLFSYQNRRENRRVLIYFVIAITLPTLFILWASVKLFLLMIGCFGLGRAAQYYVQTREEREYSSLPMSDSRLVFAAIPV